MVKIFANHMVIWPWSSRSNLTLKSDITSFWVCPHGSSSPIHDRTAKFGQNLQNTLVKIPMVLGGWLTLTFKVEFKLNSQFHYIRFVNQNAYTTTIVNTQIFFDSLQFFGRVCLVLQSLWHILRYGGTNLHFGGGGNSLPIFWWVSPHTLNVFSIWCYLLI